MTEVDKSLFLFLNKLNHSWLNPVMEILSGQVIWLPLILTILWIAFKLLSRVHFAVFILFIVLAIIASDVTSSYILKNIFERYRPCRLAELKPLINYFGQKCGGKYGFVSSHAANSLALVTLTIFGLRLSTPLKHLLWLMPLLVGYSRIYLGVHYPGDILGGFMVGLIYGLLLSFVFRNLGSQTA